MRFIEKFNIGCGRVMAKKKITANMYEDIPLEWYVYYHDVNAKEIKVLNIFNHRAFKTAVWKHLQECTDRSDFSEQVRGELFYYFGCKCEYEVLICSWCGDYADSKVDIYSQVRLNFDVFVDYLWSKK